MDNRHLDFNAFVAQRATQIANFTSILQADTRKKGHQSLPKSVRRRAMSHNRYRIPLRLRRPMEEELIKSQMMQRLPKCRKNIRKSRLLITSYQKRNQRQKWLSTHLWSVKRMQMMDYHGYKIALKPKDKCFRSAYRHFRHNACLMDFSYLQCLVLNIKEKQKFSQIQFSQTFRQFHFSHIKLLDENKNVICPAIAFPESETLIRCFYDPCCSIQIQQSEWEGAESKIQKTVQFYLLLGPQSLNRVKQVLQNLDILSKDQNQDFQSLKIKPNLLMYIGNTSNDKIVNKPLISHPHQQKIAQKYNPTTNDCLRQQFFRNLELRKKKNGLCDETNISKFWQYHRQKKQKDNENYEGFKSIFKVTTRSRYTHKRRSKVTKQQKRQYLKNQEQITQKIQKQVKQIQNQQKAPTIHIEEQKCFGPFLVSWFHRQDCNKGLYQGCFVLCGSENKCQFWRNLTRTNIKVIGRREYQHCLLESGIRSFPNDYFEAKSFLAFNETRAQGLKVRNLSKPPQKRINFDKILSPSPFSFVMPQCYARPVRILMVSGGRCFPGSYICKLRPQDLANAEKQLSQNSCIKKVLMEQGHEQSKGQMKEGEVTVEMTETKREMIGCVTSGGFLFNECREGGIGYIWGDEIKQYVLVRKPSSRYYFLAQIMQAQM